LRRVAVATLVAGSLLPALTAALWMNPLTIRLILTTPFNQYRKPLHLIAYELALQLQMALVEALVIARVLWPSPREG